jgi:O-antigen/teichoic acid export membrane protein
VFGIGTMIARLPLDLLLKLVNAVGLPLLSRSEQQGSGFQQTFRRFRLPFLTAGAAALGALILGGPAIIRLLYDDRYLDAGWILQVVAVACWFQVLECSNAVALLAKGQPKWIAAGCILKVVLLAVALPLGYRFYGFPGALIAVSATEIPRYLLVAAATRRAGAYGWRIEAIFTAAVFVSAALAAALVAWRGALGSAALASGAAAAGFAILWLPLVFAAWKRWKAAAP